MSMYNYSSEVIDVRMWWKTALLIFFLGVLCPWVIMRLVETNDRPMRESVPVSTVGEMRPADKLQTVAVLDLQGETVQLSMEDYLTAVLLCEVPASFELEALKAQAVVARTYVMHRMKMGSKHGQAAVCMNSACCQGYKSSEDYLKSGGKQEDVKKIESAVRETEDLVLVYNGKLIEATYFSCSGGKTEDAKDVWGQDVPYLQSTESPGEEGAARYTETVVYKADELAKALGRQLPGNPAKWIESITHTTGGGVKTIRICGVEYSGVDIRQILSLRSSSFTITAVGDSVVITTRGFGHRVGMSQYGADAMAVSGKSFEEILKHYYRGVDLIAYAWDD